MKTSNKAPNIILRLLSHFTPRPRPVIPDPMKIIIINTVIEILVILLFGTWKT